ncbi:DUF692 domain-containing protein [Mesorhizobium sp. M1380]|uniref:DUF692 domain-containing protein n=1 Tax=Mesorhizobium sp. M1380 TaxID=2957093 RepID=UPI00333A9434
MKSLPNLGVGVSYRRSFGRRIFDFCSEIGVVEIVADNVPRPLSYEFVESLRDHMPLICHSLDLSLGTDEPIDFEYADRIARTVDRLKAPWLGDHLAMTRIDGRKIGHLLPLSFSSRSVEIVTQNVSAFQSRTGIPLILENITYYYRMPGAEMSEYEFISAVCASADCGILLDLNNLYINSVNHSYDPIQFLEGIPLDRIVQVHLAGSQWQDSILVDSHADPVSDEVWRLLSWVAARCQPNAVILEWDRNFPPFEAILAQIVTAKKVIAAARGSEMSHVS